MKTMSVNNYSYTYQYQDVKNYINKIITIILIVATGLFSTEMLIAGCSSDFDIAVQKEIVKRAQDETAQALALLAFAAAGVLGAAADPFLEPLAIAALNTARANLLRKTISMGIEESRLAGMKPCCPKNN